MLVPTATPTPTPVPITAATPAAQLVILARRAAAPEKTEEVPEPQAEVPKEAACDQRPP